MSVWLQLDSVPAHRVSIPWGGEPCHNYDLHSVLTNMHAAHRLSLVTDVNFSKSNGASTVCKVRIQPKTRDKCMVVVVALSSLARILGECSTIHSPPPPPFFFFFGVGGVRSARILIHAMAARICSHSQQNIRSVDHSRVYLTQIRELSAVPV